jgi:hypothetical protein
MRGLWQWDLSINHAGIVRIDLTGCDGTKSRNVEIRFHASGSTQVERDVRKLYNAARALPGVWKS